MAHVYLVQYVAENYETGEIRNKIWLFEEGKVAREFFERRRKYIKRITKNDYKVAEFDDKSYYHVTICRGDIYSSAQELHTIYVKRSKVK